MLTIVKVLSFLTTLVSGLVYGLWSKDAGFVMVAVGGATQMICLFVTHYRTVVNLSVDLEKAHHRLLDLGQHVWVIDQLAHIVEREKAPKKLRDEVLDLQDEWRGRS